MSDYVTKEEFYHALKDINNFYMKKTDEIPKATSKTFGGIKADEAKTTDTMPVRIGTDGKLYTAPGGGADISLGISGATAGQMAKIKAVNESGAPTAWEAGDAAGGSDDVWELLHDITLEEDVTGYRHEFPDRMKKLRIVVDTLAADSNTNYSGFTIEFEGEAQYCPTIGPIYPFAIPRTSAGRSVYDISTYYYGDTPMCEIRTSFQINNNIQNNTIGLWIHDSIRDRYKNGLMLPKIVSFSQNTYGTFATGTRYRIYGVKA